MWEVINDRGVRICQAAVTVSNFISSVQCLFFGNRDEVRYLIKAVILNKTEMNKNKLQWHSALEY